MMVQKVISDITGEMMAMTVVLFTALAAYCLQELNGKCSFILVCFSVSTFLSMMLYNTTLTVT